MGTRPPAQLPPHPPVGVLPGLLGAAAHFHLHPHLQAPGSAPAVPLCARPTPGSPSHPLPGAHLSRTHGGAAPTPARKRAARRAAPGPRPGSRTAPGPRPRGRGRRPLELGGGRVRAGGRQGLRAAGRWTPSPPGGPARPSVGRRRGRGVSGQAPPPPPCCPPLRAPREPGATWQRLPEPRGSPLNGLPGAPSEGKAGPGHPLPRLTSCPVPAGLECSSASSPQRSLQEALGQGWAPGLRILPVGKVREERAAP